MIITLVNLSHYLLKKIKNSKFTNKKLESTSDFWMYRQFRLYNFQHFEIKKA